MDNIQLCYIDNEINKIDKMKQGDVIYGNAIVPLIAVKIFEMINKIEGYEQQTTL